MHMTASEVGIPASPPQAAPSRSGQRRLRSRRSSYLAALGKAWAGGVGRCKYVSIYVCMYDCIYIICRYICLCLSVSL